VSVGADEDYLHLLMNSIKPLGCFLGGQCQLHALSEWLRGRLGGSGGISPLLRDTYPEGSAVGGGLRRSVRWLADRCDIGGGVLARMLPVL
jgi:hypothetical protein